MGTFTVKFDGDEIDAQASREMTKEDALRVLAYLGRRFGTSDPNEIAARFAEVTLDMVCADAVQSERQIAAAAAADEVPPIISVAVTP